MPTDLLGRDYETVSRSGAAADARSGEDHRHVQPERWASARPPSSINIAGALSQYGRRVLIVDFDPQGAATVGLGINANTVEDTVYTALFNPRMDVHDVIRHTDFENLDIMRPTLICPPLKCSWSPKLGASRCWLACCVRSRMNTM